MNTINLDDIAPEIIDTNYFRSLKNDNSLDITFHYKSNFLNTKYLRDYLVSLLDVFQIENIWKNRFVLIIDELNNNAIEYGSHENDINSMHIIITQSENNLDITMEVCDSGKWEKHKTAQEMEDLRTQRLETWFDNHKSIRGRGLFLIITKLVDKLYFEDSAWNGLIVGIHKKLLLTTTSETT